MNTSPNLEPEPKSGLTRKAYSKPQLQIYGDLREITQNVGSAGVLDGKTMSGMTNTH
jgi:hypothetical protein